MTSTDARGASPVRGRQGDLDELNFAAGLRSALPIVMGYIPIGFAFGVLARGQGLSITETGALSLIVYAGSSQFVGAGLIGAGAAPATIIATTFLINLRHLLMSAALAPALRRVRPSLQAILSWGITDESFVAATSRLQGREAPPAFLAGLFFTAYLSWFASSILGAVLGSWAAGARRLGLDFALPAMFIALMVMQFKGRDTVIVAAIAGALSLLSALYLPGNYNVILATVVAATAGMVMKK